jgi:hypothetical protein
MKDSEFLELLNLYLDHEITAADAARLEAEVQANPQRRDVYQDYCRMQKACTLLAKDFVDQPAERKVVGFETRRSAWTPGFFATGGLAIAAACVALVMINRSPTAASGTDTPTTVAVAPAQPAERAPAAVAATAPAPTTLITRTVTTTPVRRSDATAVPLMLAGVKPNSGDAVLAATQQTAQAQFEWMRNVQLAPIQQLPLTELRLDARSPLQSASRTYSSQPSADNSVHMAAFRFQK